MKSSVINLGTYLREKREAQKLTQSEVAKILGYKSPQFISNWERNEAQPPIEAIRTLIQVYKLSKTEIIEMLIEGNKQFLEQELGQPGKKGKVL